jgi:hypothetical protein
MSVTNSERYNNGIYLCCIIMVIRLDEVRIIKRTVESMA